MTSLEGLNEQKEELFISKKKSFLNINLFFEISFISKREFHRKCDYKTNSAGKVYYCLLRKALECLIALNFRFLNLRVLKLTFLTLQTFIFHFLKNVYFFENRKSFLNSVSALKLLNNNLFIKLNTKETASLDWPKILYY